MAGTPAEVLFGSCKTCIGPIRISVDRFAGDRSFRRGEDRDHNNQASFHFLEDQHFQHDSSFESGEKDQRALKQPQQTRENEARGEEVLEV